MIDTVLIALLITSLCTTGAFFLKWIAAKNEVSQRDRQIAEMKDSHAKEITDVKARKGGQIVRSGTG